MPTLAPKGEQGRHKRNKNTREQENQTNIKEKTTREQEKTEKIKEQDTREQENQTEKTPKQTEA